METADKLRKVYSLKYTEIPGVFFTLNTGDDVSKATKVATNATIVSKVTVAIM
jgi:hypothetical protein